MYTDIFINQNLYLVARSFYQACIRFRRQQPRSNYLCIFSTQLQSLQGSHIKTFYVLQIAVVCKTIQLERMHIFSLFWRQRRKCINTVFLDMANYLASTKKNLANNSSVGAINIKMVILETRIIIHKILANWILWF